MTSDAAAGRPPMIDEAGDAPRPRGREIVTTLAGLGGQSGTVVVHEVRGCRALVSDPYQRVRIAGKSIYVSNVPDAVPYTWWVTASVLSNLDAVMDALEERSK